MFLLSGDKDPYCGHASPPFQRRLSVQLTLYLKKKKALAAAEVSNNILPYLSIAKLHAETSFTEYYQSGLCPFPDCI